MKNIRSTLATVWRIAAPYFSSEDKWAGRALLAAVIAIELALVGNTVLLNQWRNRFYNALQENDWDGFVREIIVFSVLATVLVVIVDLPALSQPVASDPLAALDDHANISVNGCTTPTTTACSCRVKRPTTPTSA